jgi:hypothetical protein
MNNNTNLQNLLWTIAEVPAQHRQHMHNVPVIYGEHITTATPEEIGKGITTKSSHQSYNRPDASYFFLTPHTANDVKIVLGNVKEYTVVTLAIPGDEIAKMNYDGLYNVGFVNANNTAVQYFGNIKSEWIVEAKTVKN